MRPIKFRAWRKTGKTMMPENTLLQIIDLSARLKGLVDPQDVMWMQFTGLTDKNGVDIYENDLVKWGHVKGYEEHTPRIAIVNMDISLSFNTINLGENDHEFNYGNFMYARSINKCMEVIGNIHQSPELIESK